MRAPRRQSQCLDYVHQILDFAGDGGSARTQVVLHTETGKKVRINSATESAFIFGRSAAIFLAALVCFCFE
jgi:hypothetical protein